MSSVPVMLPMVTRATGKLGVAIPSTGPGAANAVPGSFAADFASLRVRMLTGQVDTPPYGKGNGALHEAERQVEMLRAVCRRVQSPRSPVELVPAILPAARDVMTGRRQRAAMEVPIDLQCATLDDAPSSTEMQRLLDALVARVLRCLEHDGPLIRDAEQPWLDLESRDALNSLGAASIQYRIAVGPHAGRKALTLKCAAAAAPKPLFTVPKPFTVARDGFSLNAG